MPAKLKVRIIAARDLPVMDRSSELTDAFVEVKFTSVTHKTDVYRKSLNPQWNSDWFRFEIDDADLQDEPLQIRVLDHDTYSANDAIGKVYIELKPLLMKERGCVINGWFPIYDTMHGIRGELNVIAKLDLFSDFNKFRQSSVGVQFFCTSGVPHGNTVLAVQGFVEELVVNDDPEYQWIDKIRSQRASNEARQVQFAKLSGELQRKIGLKVLEMGGNSVVGYHQCFDLEGESGVVVRAIGTSVTLGKFNVNVASPHSASPVRDPEIGPSSPYLSVNSLDESSYQSVPTTPMAPLAPPLVSVQDTSPRSSTSDLSSTKNLSNLGDQNELSDAVGDDLRAIKSAPDLAELGNPHPAIVVTQNLERGSSRNVAASDTSAAGDDPSTDDMSTHSLQLHKSKQSKLSKTKHKHKHIDPWFRQPPPVATGSTHLFQTKLHKSAAHSRSSTKSSSGKTRATHSRQPQSHPHGLPHNKGSGFSGPPRFIDLYSPDSLPLPEDALAPSSPPSTAVSPGCKLPSSPAKTSSTTAPLATNRRSSDSDAGTPPKGSQGGSSGSGGGGGFSFSRNNLNHRLHMQHQPQHSIDMLEYPLFSIKKFPPGFLIHLGGMVSARSVKLLDRIHNPDEPETRDAWWMELRTEISSHARALGCHAVVGYKEHTSICGEIIVLSASGTAAIVNLRMDPDVVIRQSLLTMSLDSRHKVPDILLTTIEMPSELPVVGKGALIQARICRTKKEAKSEANAKEISDCLPFMEYELYNQLVNKLKVKGMNALFGLKIQVTVGERLLVAIGTGTAVYCSCLPPPALPKILGKAETSTDKHPSKKRRSFRVPFLKQIDVESNEKVLPEMQRRIIETVNRNREIYQLNYQEVTPTDGLSLTDEDDESIEADLVSGNKDTFLLEIDDAEDVAVVSVLLDPPVPDGFDVCTTEILPGSPNVACNLQSFMRVWRGELTEVNNRTLAAIFDNMLKTLFFKLRAMTPCCLSHLDFDVQLHDEDEIQVSVTGICLGMGEPPSLTNGLIGIIPESKQDFKTANGNGSLTSDNDELQFSMDGFADSAPIPPTIPLAHQRVVAKKPEKKIQYYCEPLHRMGVELSPLTFIPGGKIESYLGHLNFFIIRETTSVRESGGLNGFMHSFLSEVMSLCRAHVRALGGNALVAYQMSQCVLEDHLHKNQSQCLVNVCGDVVHVQYDHDLLYQSASSAPRNVSPLVPSSGTKKSTPRSSPRASPKIERAHKS